MAEQESSTLSTGQWQRMEESNRVIELRRYLFDLARQWGFKFDPEVRKEIRKKLTLTLACQLTHLDKFFPKVFEEYSKVGGQNIVKKIETDFHWDLRLYYQKYGFDNMYMSNYHRNLSCARIFHKGEPIYRCFTCGLDEACALCSYCFKEEYHRGHKIRVNICQQESGGVCDCGDPEAWTEYFRCPCSTEMPESSEVSDKGTRKLEETFYKVLETLLDFFIDVMSGSDGPIDDRDDESSIHKRTFWRSLDSCKYGFDPLSGRIDQESSKYCLVVYNDQVRHCQDAVQRIRLSTKKVPQFARMVADKVHGHGRGLVMISRNIEILRERKKILTSTGLVACIENARDFFREDMCDEIMLWLRALTASDVFKQSVRAKDLLSRAFCCKWNKGRILAEEKEDYEYEVGLLDSSLNIPRIIPDNHSHKSKNADHWAFHYSKWNLPDTICQECDYNTDQEVLNNFLYHGSRIQYFFYLDIRSWKSMRSIIHEMFWEIVVTNLTYKNIICFQYVDIYPVIADMFLTKDREPELNVMCKLSLQLFICPSNAASIVQHGDLTRIFAVIYSFLTVQKVLPPEDLDLSLGLLLRSLKNRRWSQIFFDIGYVLSRNKNTQFLFKSNIIPMACDVLSLFQGKPAMKRESKNHVEYESPDYTAFFHPIPVIYQLAECIAHSLRKFRYTDSDLVMEYSKNAIAYIVRYLVNLENDDVTSSAGDNDIKGLVRLQVLQEPLHGYWIEDFRIDEEFVSLLHPIHSFLSWLIEFSQINTTEELGSLIESSASSALVTSSNSSVAKLSKASLILFEYPLRSSALTYQIKSGFWVRNGFSVKTQVQLYRNSSLRESGYMRDIFLNQVLCNISVPDLFVFLCLSRWFCKSNSSGQQNLPYKRGWLGDSVYDERILPFMVEESLIFFINVISEDLHLRSLSPEKVSELRIRNEIIHNLCFKPMSYSHLCTQIADHIAGHIKFDTILQDLTDFIPLTEPNGVGIYKLKEKYLEEVNPYYINDNPNRRDEAIKICKDLNYRKSRKGLCERVIRPKIKQPEVLKPYSYIGNFSVSNYFRDYLNEILMSINAGNLDSLESLLETILHLIHICSYEQLIDKRKYGTFYDQFCKPADSGKSIAAILYHLLNNKSFEGFHAKILEIFRVFEDKYGEHVSEVLKEQVDDFESFKLKTDFCQFGQNEFEKKKKVAKERQNKLVAKFRKQQTLFLEKNLPLHDYSDSEMEPCEVEEGWRFPEPHCILCQNASDDAGPFGIITYIGKSSEFHSIPFDDHYWFLKAFSDSPNLDSPDNCDATEAWYTYMRQVKSRNVFGPGFPTENVNNKLVSLSCGHGMHFQCYLNYLHSSRCQVNQITRHSPENIEQKEFLCPLCKSLNNMFIPILWSSNNKSLSKFLKRGKTNDIDVIDRLNSQTYHDRGWFSKLAEAANIEIGNSVNLSNEASKMLRMSSFEESDRSRKFKLIFSKMCETLTLLTFPRIFKADSTNVLVNSIKSSEICLRGTSSEGSLLISQLSNKTLINLRILNEFRNTSLLVKLRSENQSSSLISDTYIKLLAYMMNLAPECFSRSIMEQDFFELLVNLLPLPSIGFLFNSYLRMSFLGHVIQNLFMITYEIIKHNYYENASYSLYDIPDIGEIGEEVKLSVYEAFKNIASQISPEFKASELSVEFGEVIYTMLLKACTPFLRRAAIYAFVNCANMDSIFFENDVKRCEADRLCEFMNIDSVGHLLQKFWNIDNFVEAQRFHAFLSSLKFFLADKLYRTIWRKLEYPGQIRLIDLPNHLDSFFTDYYYLERFECPYKRIDDPAICLFCAKMLDTQKKAVGCNTGQCTTHFLKECPNSVGIFLLPKEKSFLLLYKNGGSFHSTPYVDIHGELPSEIKHTTLLRLVHSSYDDFIRNSWLLHELINYITRKLDSVIDAGGWDSL